MQLLYNSNQELFFDVESCRLNFTGSPVWYYFDCFSLKRHVYSGVGVFSSVLTLLVGAWEEYLRRLQWGRRTAETASSTATAAEF